jgi:hypothetical protein
VNIAFFNLIFTHTNEACQKHLLEDSDSCAIKALKSLQRHCAPITDDHVEKMDIQFRSLVQGENEVATSYFNRIRETKRDCYHAGILLLPIELLSRAIRGASTHQFYDTTYKSYERKLDDFKMNSSLPEPTFVDLETSLARIDERRGLTVPGQQRRSPNQQANYASIGQRNQSSTNRPPFQRRPFGNNNSSYNRSRQNDSRNQTRTPNSTSTGSRYCTHCNRPGHSFVDCRTRLRESSSNRTQPTNRYQPNQNRFRAATNNLSNRTGENNINRSNTTAYTPRQAPNRQHNGSSNRGPCHTCGQVGHYARDCTSRTRGGNNSSNSSNRSNPPRRNNTDNRGRGNNSRALLAQSANTTVSDMRQMSHFETALVATMDKTSIGFHEITQTVDIAPLMELPTHGELDQREPASISNNTNSEEDSNGVPMPPYNPIVMNDYIKGSTEFFHEDPSSNHQKFGPPILQNWLPDSGATSHFTPVFSDLVNAKPSCHHVQMADGSTVVASYVGDVPCYFTNDQGEPSTILLSQVYYVAGLNYRLLSLLYSTTVIGNTVTIANNATTLTFPNDTTFTWPILRRDRGHRALMASKGNDDETTKRTISQATSDQPSLPLELVSQRLGYRNVRTLLTGSLHNVWHDSQLVPSTDNNNWPVKVSVSHKHARSKEPQRSSDKTFNYIHLDLIRNPYRFGLTAATNYSAYLFIVATPGKLVGWVGLQEESTEALLAGLKSWLVETEQLGRKHKVRFIRTDAGSAFTSTDFIKECVDLNIKIEAAAPKHQEMNGVCESKWKQVHSLANTLLNNARLGGAFFHFAHAYAVRIVNILPAKNIVDSEDLPTTPYQLCYDRKPRIRNFRTFGCPMYFKRYEPHKDTKIVTKKQQIQQASRGIYLGFPDNSAGWLVYSAEMKHRLEISRDAYFDESFHSALTFDSKPFEGAVPIRDHMDPLELIPAYTTTPDKKQLKVGNVADLGVLPSIFAPEGSTAVETVDSSDEDEDEVPLTQDIDLDHMADSQERALSAVKQDFSDCYEWAPITDPNQMALAAIDSSLSKINEQADIHKYLPEPQSFKAVLQLDPAIRKAWLHAIHLEIKNLIDNKTFIQHIEPNKGELVTPVKLVLKAKQTATGNLDKLKARLVARGDYQKRRMKKRAQRYVKAVELQKQINKDALVTGKEPVNLKLPSTPEEDTWSPNASARAVKLFIAVMILAHRIIKSADFIGAYLQANMVGRHFVMLPIEYADVFPEYKEYFGVPLLLNKGIYGMVFSGKLWNEEYTRWLLSQGFTQSQSDPSIFVRHYANGQWLKLIFFVDDMLYCGSNDTVERDFQASVNDRFHVKFLGPAHWFLQMRIHRHKDRTCTLDQHRYALNTLQRYDPNNTIKERSTPLPTDYIFSKENRPKTAADIEIIKLHYDIDFRSATCTLLYLAYNTRADILFAVTKLAKACVCPGIADYEALYWLLGYIKQRPDLAIKFYPDSKKNPITDICSANSIPHSDLTIFTDASWQDCPDTGRSTVGYMIFYLGALIEANTTVPVPVAQSSAEAEYLGACCGAMAAAHIRMIIYDLLYLGTPEWQQHSQILSQTPTVLMTDNAATVQIAKNGRLTRKTRHIERRFHFVKEGQQNGLHSLHWLPGTQMLADIMTKTQPAYKIDPHLPSCLSQLPSHMTRGTTA